MSRIMKFRFWDGEQINLPCQLYTMTLDGIIEYDGGSVGVSQHPEYEVMQYTGINSASLDEVWECDITTDNVGKGIVEYSEKYAAFRINYRNGRCKWFYDFLDSEKKTLEVIGNIYQNPELLEN